jgi:hypothetical protein
VALFHRQQARFDFRIELIGKLFAQPVVNRLGLSQPNPVHNRDAFRPTADANMVAFNVRARLRNCAVLGRILEEPELLLT